MTTEELKQQNIQIFKSLHAEWLNQPMTTALNGVIKRHESTLASKISLAAMDKDVTSEYVRLLGAQLSIVQTIKNLINDANTFTAKCSTAGEI